MTSIGGERIKSLSMTMTEIIAALAEGNPSAITVLCRLYAESPTIDPDHILGGMGPLLFLDTLHIYGSNIWMLWKDVCGFDTVFTLAYLRAVQLGIVTEAELHGAIAGDRAYAGYSSKYLIGMVRERLPRFDVVHAAKEAA